MYLPAFKDANTVKNVLFENHVAVLLDAVEPEGPVYYLFLLIVLDPKTRQPVLVVSSERSTADQEVFLEKGGEAPPTFLCVFRDEEHLNYGPSPEWEDIIRFEKKAISIVEELLGEKNVPPENN
ncbi:MAG: hypothetical protein ACYS8W_06430 [Planctomycetota bacterium]